MIGEIKKLAHLLRDFPLFILVGIGAGFVGYAFRLFVSWAGNFRHQYPILIFLLPITALFITALYRFVLKDRKNGTKTVISAVRINSSLKTVQLPLVFLASILTHLTGGSAGREGAVLEMGGVLGNQAVSLLRSPVKKGRRHHKIRFLSEQETYDTQRRVAILCGMAGAFSALFVTPLAAVIFVLEVTDSRQIIHRFVPVFITSIISFIVVCLLGWEPTRLPLSLPESLPTGSLFRVVILACACSIVGRLFCVMIKGVPRLARLYIKQSYLRVFLASSGVLLLTLLLKTDKYNGLGIETINEALQGKGNYDDFIWKTILTALTITSGLKGGEIIPAIFVGATFGAAFSPLIGILPNFGAVVSIVGILTSVAKVPVAAFLLGIELFGIEGIMFYGVTSIICYFLSGRKGLYS